LISYEVTQVEKAWKVEGGKTNSQRIKHLAYIKKAIAIDLGMVL